MNWLIAIPCWGDNYRGKFFAGILPSINAALEGIQGNIRFLVHTDRPEDFYNAPFRGTLELRGAPGDACIYTAFGNAHREALSIARSGECIAFLTSDIVVSREAFVNAERRFAEGKRAIVITAARTLAIPSECPAGAPSRDLLAWSLSHRHPVTSGCFWGIGHNPVTWALYFQGPNGIVLRAFHLHPFAVQHDRPLSFDRETVDLDLLERFDRSEIHVVTDPDEMSFAEISGMEKSLPQGDILGINSTVRWAMYHTTPLHRWLFTHRIVVAGNGDDHLDDAPCEEILRMLGQ